MENTREKPDARPANYSSKVQAVVENSGPSDFTRDHDQGGDSFLAQFLGSKDKRVWQDASPVFHVAKDNSPFLIVHGTRDREVPISQSEELDAALKAAGVAVELVKVDDVHTFQNPEARRELALQTLAFFDRYLTESK